MKNWVQHERVSRLRALCASCGQPIVLVPRVGWVLDLRGADTYDLCETNRFGNHAPIEPTRQQDALDRTFHEGP